MGGSRGCVVDRGAVFGALYLVACGGARNFEQFEPAKPWDISQTYSMVCVGSFMAFKRALRSLHCRSRGTQMTYNRSGWWS
jgi:hypothetical protein